MASTEDNDRSVVLHPLETEPDANMIYKETPTIVLELDMDGRVTYLSKVWEGIVGTSVKKITNKHVREVIVGNDDDRQVFNRAIDIMTIDDSSYRVRFVTPTNEVQTEQNYDNESEEDYDDQESLSSVSTNGGLIELEGQGILIHDPKTKLPSHSMWFLKPFCEVDEFDNLPSELVELLGGGAFIFNTYLVDIEQSGALTELELPTPKNELCRICDQPVPPWWLERHSQLCLVEHQIESQVQLYHDNLLDHKQLLADIKENIANGTSGEYKGLPLPKIQADYSPGSSTGSSGSSTPVLRKMPMLQSLRFPFRNLAMLELLCEEAIKVNTSELKDEEYQFSPKSSEYLEHVSSFKTLESTDPAIKELSADTYEMSQLKIQSVLRLDNAVKYTQRIKYEIDGMVLGLISEAIENNNLNRMPIDSMVSRLSKSASAMSLSTDIVSPKPLKRLGSPNFFSDAYLQADKIPDLNHSHESPTPLSRSLTPKQHSSRGSTPSQVAENHDWMHMPVPDRAHQNILPTLQTASTPRRSSPGPSTTPLSSIQRNSKPYNLLHRDSVASITSASKPNSPFLFPESGSMPSEEKNPNPMTARMSRSGSLSISVKNSPLSPMLLATNQAKPSPLGPKDYDFVKPISKGAFGSVYLAKRKVTGEYFAIKVLRKSDMIAKNQVTNVKAERAIMMSQSDKKYVVKLFASFQNTNTLFLVMEYLPGGDLATMLKMMQTLPPKWTKQYISEVIIGVQDMHEDGVIHHDLKPDNLLIDRGGHVKLTDFGLSRMGLVSRQEAHQHKGSSNFPDDPNSPMAAVAMTVANTNNRRRSSNIFERSHERTASVSSLGSLSVKPLHIVNSQASFSLPDAPRHGSDSSGTSVASKSLGTPDFALFHPEQQNHFFGTPDYLAPEMIRGAGESAASDWWSVGCILFEFMLGYPPFHAPTPEEVFENILSGQIDWPRDENLLQELVGPDAHDLISKLLVLDPEQRLGANGAQEIKKHPYFADVEWDQVYEEDAEFVPQVEDIQESTDYFDLRGANMSAYEEAINTDSEDTDIDTPINLSAPMTPRGRRPSKLGDVNSNEFGSFQFRNLNALDKANKDAINRLKIEHRNSGGVSLLGSPVSVAPSSRRSVSPMVRNGSPRSEETTPTPVLGTLAGTSLANAPTSAAASPSGDSPLVLLCEPIPILRYQIRKELENLGCTVVTASNGDSLVRRSTGGNVKFDIIFTALKLPGKVDASDVAKLLQHTNSVNSNTPIVALTAYFSEAEDSGVFDAVIEKPVTSSDLRDVLQNFSNKRRHVSTDAVVRTPSNILLSRDSI